MAIRPALVVMGASDRRRMRRVVIRGAGVALETRKSLLGHANGDITTHYSAAELDELIRAVELIFDRGRIESPNLMLLGESNRDCRKVSEMKKGPGEFQNRAEFRS